MDIFKSVQNGNLDEVRLFLEEGGNIEERDIAGRTLLMRAIMHRHSLLAYFLIERGADIHAESNSGRTALMFAAKRGFLDLVKYLFEHRAEINSMGRYTNSTALSYAFEGDHFEIAKYLLRRGAKGYIPLVEAYSTDFPLFLLLLKRKTHLSKDDISLLNELKIKANLGKYAL